MDEPKYLPKDVATAAGVPLATLRNWEREGRKLIRRSTPRKFTYRRALQVTLMGALVDLNLKPEFAARVAYHFTDTGRGALPGRPARNPGEVFEDGWTVICIFPGEHFEVKNIMPDDDAVSLFKPTALSRSDAVVCLNVTFLPDRLRAILET